jgi:glycosyltransferase involved in cell wall biosynthesis
MITVTADKKSPLVSIIIPTFNRKKRIETAIVSVLHQTYKNFELIIVDDGSRDETEKVIKQYGNHLLYFFQTNQGVSAARNLGIEKSKGSYICFLDSDDAWLENKLETQVNLIRANPQIKICFTDEIWIRNGIRVNPKKIHRKYSGWIYQKCLPLCIISPSSVMIHREVFEQVGRFDPQMTVCEDYDLWLRISHHYPLTFIPQRLVIKKGGHQDQLSRKYWGMDQYRVRALEKMLQNYTLSPADKKATLNTLHRKCEILANGFNKRGKKQKADYYTSLKKKYD